MVLAGTCFVSRSNIFDSADAEAFLQGLFSFEFLLPFVHKAIKRLQIFPYLTQLIIYTKVRGSGFHSSLLPFLSSSDAMLVHNVAMLVHNATMLCLYVFIHNDAMLVAILVHKSLNA